MPNVPFVYTLTNIAPDALNAIRNEAGNSYKDYVVI